MADRFVVKNGKIYDLGVEISPNELQNTIARNYESLANNQRQLEKAPADMRPIMQKFATLAEDKIGPELQQALSIRERLGQQQAIAEILRSRAMKRGE